MSKLDDFWAKRGDKYRPLTAAERAEYDRLVAEEDGLVAPTSAPAAATANATESVEGTDSGEPGAFTKYAGIPFRGGAVSGVLTRNFLKALTGMKNSDQDLLVMDPNQVMPVGTSGSEDTPERQTAKEIERVANQILNEGRPGVGQQLRDAILGRDKTSPSSEFTRQAAAEKKAYEILGLPVPKGVEQRAEPGLGMRAMNLGLDVALDPMTYIGLKPALTAGKYVAGKTAASKSPKIAKLGSMAPAGAENAMISGILGTNPATGGLGLGITRYLAGKGLTKYAPEFVENNPTLMRIIGGPKYGTPAAGTAAKLLAEGVEEAPVAPAPASQGVPTEEVAKVLTVPRRQVSPVFRDAEEAVMPSPVGVDPQAVQEAAELAVRQAVEKTARARAPQFKSAPDLLDLVEPEQQMLSTTRNFPRKGQFGYDPTATQTPFANIPQRAVPEEVVDPEQLRLFNPDEQLKLFGQSPLEDPAKLPQVQALLQRMNPRYTGGPLASNTANAPVPLLQFMLRQEEFDKGVGDLVGQLRKGSATGKLRGKFASAQSRELADQIANALEDPALSPAMKRVLRQQWIEAAVKAGQLQPSVGQGLYNMSDKYIK